MDAFHLERIDKLLARIDAKVAQIVHNVSQLFFTQERMKMTLDELLTELNDVKVKLVAGIATLQSEIAAQNNATPGLVAIGADLEVIANALPVAQPLPAP